MECVLDQLREGVIILDTEARIHRTNNTFLVLVRHPRDDVIGKDVSEYCVPKGLEDMKDILPSEDENGTTVCEMILKSGNSEIPVSAEISRIRNAVGTPLGHLLLLRMPDGNAQM